jgi:hypothetical protein
VKEEKTLKQKESLGHLDGLYVKTVNGGMLDNSGKYVTLFNVRKINSLHGRKSIYIVLFVGFFVDDIILFAFFFSRKGGRFE